MVLVWEPIPADEANGELTYDVTINVRDPDVKLHRKRETVTNTLDQCLEAANISRVISESVPGTQNMLKLNNIGMPYYYVS